MWNLKIFVLESDKNKSLEKIHNVFNKIWRLKFYVNTEKENERNTKKADEERSSMNRAQKVDSKIVNILNQS